jgi:hypothetical protein
MPFHALGYRAGSASLDHPDHFAPLLAEMHFERVPGCDQIFGGMPVGCFMHDWKSEPWLVWRDRSSRL